jgi:hypothetical protein
MHIDDLATFMFKENKHNKLIELSLGGIEDNKDLFFFCLDLFCKGLVMLYGEDGKSVSIDKITEQQFKIIQQKMICAGIRVNLSIYPLDIDIDTLEKQENKKSIINIEELNNASNNMSLEAYEFKLINGQMIYVVNFEIIHNTTL